MINIHILELTSSLLLCFALFTFCLVFYLPIIILPFSLPVCLSVRLCAIFNVLRGHMSTPNATEQIRYFVCVHSSFGPIHVLAFCYCHAWWGFLRCPPRERNTFQGLSAEAHIHTLSGSISFRLTFYIVHRTRCLRTATVEKCVPNLWGIAREFWKC